MPQNKPIDGNADTLAALEVFTTGQAARACGVSQQTIIRSFDAGRLTGFRVPGSRFRRIPREDLLRFMRKNNLPTATLQRSWTALIATADDDIRTTIAKALHATGDGQTLEATTSHDAVLLTALRRPAAAVLDAGLFEDATQAVVARFMATPELAGVRLCVLVEPGTQQWLTPHNGTNASNNSPLRIEKPLTQCKALSQITDLVDTPQGHQ